MAKLVSIITPCYNGEKYLKRYFESILSQTYPSIELIFVNDGSTDNTEAIALDYGKKLQDKGYIFKYIYQDNAGQSAAINQGLKIFTGEYLNWADADDYTPEYSVARRVEFLENHPDVGLVIGRSVVVEDRNYSKIGMISETGLGRTDVKALIEDFLGGKISCCSCSATMVRSSMFRDAMPDVPQIETPREIGQNYQLFIPIMFKYPVRYIQDELAFYLVHSDSHSHSRKTFEQRMHIQDVATATLNSIADRLRTNNDDKAWFKEKIKEYDCKNRFEVMQHYRRSDNLNEIIKEMKNLGCYDFAARKMVMKIKNSFVKEIGDKLWLLKKQTKLKMPAKDSHELK